jgi:hypothetical protein
MFESVGLTPTLSLGAQAEGGLTKQIVSCAQLRVGTIIGTKGVTIKAIQKLSGARLNVVEYTETQSAINVVGELCLSLGALIYCLRTADLFSENPSRWPRGNVFPNCSAR